MPKPEQTNQETEKNDGKKSSQEKPRGRTTTTIIVLPLARILGTRPLTAMPKPRANGAAEQALIFAGELPAGDTTIRAEPRVSNSRWGAANLGAETVTSSPDILITSAIEKKVSMTRLWRISRAQSLIRSYSSIKLSM